MKQLFVYCRCMCPAGGSYQGCNIAIAAPAAPPPPSSRTPARATVWEASHCLEGKLTAFETAARHHLKAETVPVSTFWGSRSMQHAPNHNSRVRPSQRQHAHQPMLKSASCPYPREGWGLHHGHRVQDRVSSLSLDSILSPLFALLLAPRCTAGAARIAGAGSRKSAHRPLGAQWALPTGVVVLSECHSYGCSYALFWD